MAWKKTDKWRPARTGTASGGGGVEDSETGVVGFAKSTFAHREKLASDLAARVGVTVPKVVLDRIDGGGQVHAISIAHGRESIDLALLRDRLADRFNSSPVQSAIRRASGLLPFHAWLATRDLKDEHLVVATAEAAPSPGQDVAADPDPAYTVAAIDFAYALEWQQPDGGPVRPPGAPQTLTANVDKNVVAETLGRIEAVTDEEIRNYVNALPDELVSTPEKQRLTSGLIARRSKIKEVMKQQGWLP